MNKDLLQFLRQEPWFLEVVSRLLEGTQESGDYMYAALAVLVYLSEDQMGELLTLLLVE